MICQGCNKQKHTLTVIPSRVLPMFDLKMCDVCITNDIEPRWAIIICGRSSGWESVKDYILERRYVGAEITAIELTV